MAKNLSFDRGVTPDNPITAGELRSGVCILAQLIAAAFVADHPDAFGRGSDENDAQISRQDAPGSTTARPVTQSHAAKKRAHVLDTRSV